MRTCICKKTFEPFSESQFFCCDACALRNKKVLHQCVSCGIMFTGRSIRCYECQAQKEYEEREFTRVHIYYAAVDHKKGHSLSYTARTFCWNPKAFSLHMRDHKKEFDKIVQHLV